MTLGQLRAKIEEIYQLAHELNIDPDRELTIALHDPELTDEIAFYDVEGIETHDMTTDIHIIVGQRQHR